MDLDRFATPGERRVAAALVDYGLTQGYLISIGNEEGWEAKWSTDREAILSAMAATGEDHVVFHQPGHDRPSRVCSFMLIYGNDPAGSELIADHSDNVAANAAYAAVYKEA